MTMSDKTTSERNSDLPKVEMVVLEINYGNGRKDDIVVYYGDDPRDLAKQFVEKHSLKVSAVSAICSTLEQTIADFKAENDPSSYFESPISVGTKNREFTAEEETKEEFVTADDNSQNIKKQMYRPEDYKGQPPIELLVNGSPRIPTFDHSDDNVRLLNEQIVQFPTTLFAPEAQSTMHHGRNLLSSNSFDNLDRYSPARRLVAANRETNKAAMSPVVSPIAASTINTDFNFTDDEPLLFAEENPNLHSSKSTRSLPLQGEMRPSPRTRSLSSSVFPNLFVVDRNHGQIDAAHSKEATQRLEGQTNLLKSALSESAKGFMDGNKMIPELQDVLSLRPVHKNDIETVTDLEGTKVPVTSRAVTVRTGYDEIPRSSPPPPPSDSPLSADYDFFRPRSFDFEVVRNNANNEEFDMVEKMVYAPVAVLPELVTQTTSPQKRPVSTRMFDYFGSNLSGKEVQALGDNTVYSEASPTGEGYSAASAPLTISPRMHDSIQSGDNSPGLSSYERVPSPSGSSYSSNSRTIIAELKPKSEADDVNAGLTERSLEMSDSALLSRRESFENISVITLVPSPKRKESVSPVLRYARGRDDLDSEPSIGVSSSVTNVPMTYSRPSSPSQLMNINSGSHTPEQASVKDSASITPEGSVYLGIEHFYESPGHMATGLSSKAVSSRAPGIVARPVSAGASRNPNIARWDMEPVSVGSSRDQSLPRWVARPASVGSSRDQSISRWDPQLVSASGIVSGEQSPINRDKRPVSVGSSRDQPTPRWVAQPVSLGSSRDQSVSQWDPQPISVRVSGEQSPSYVRPASVGSSRDQSMSRWDMQPVSVRVSADQPAPRWDQQPVSVSGIVSGEQSPINRDKRPASVGSSRDQSVSLQYMQPLSVSVSRDQSPSDWAFTVDEPDDEEARFNALKSMSGRNSSLIPSTSTLTLNKVFKPESDLRWNTTKKITPNPILPPGHRLYDSAGKSRIKREKKILEVAEEKLELRRTSLFTVSGASVAMINNNISTNRDTDVCNRLYNNGIRELEIKKSKARSRRIEWSCIRCGVFQVYNSTSPSRPSSTARRSDTDSTDTGRLSPRSNLASSVTSEVEVSFSASQICRKCGYDQNVVVGPGRGDTSAVFIEDSYSGIGNIRSGYQKLNVSDCSSSSRGQTETSRPTIHDSLYANKKHETVMRRAIQINLRNQAIDYTFRPVIPDGSKYILDRRMRGEEASTAGYFSLEEGPGYFRDEGTRLALRSAQGDVPHRSQSNGAYPKSKPIEPKRRCSSSFAPPSKPQIENQLKEKERERVRRRSTSAPGVRNLSEYLLTPASESYDDASFDPDTLPGGPAYSKTGPPPRSRKSIQLSSDKYQDLVERLTHEHIEKNERRDRAVAEGIVKDPNTGTMYFQPAVSARPSISPFRHEFSPKGKEPIFGWTENPALKVIPVRETSPVVRKKSTDLSFVETEGPRVKRTHEEVYSDLMRKDGESQERRKSAQMQAETEGNMRRPSIALQTSDSILKEANERKVKELFLLLLSTAQNRKMTSSYSTMSFSKASNSGDMSDGTDVISDVSHCHEAGIRMNMSQTISAISTPQREKGREKDRQTTPERVMRSFLNMSSPERSMPLVPIADWETRTLDLDSVPLSSLVPDVSALLTQVRDEKTRRLLTESRSSSGPGPLELNTYSHCPDLRAMHVGYKEFSSLVTRCQQRKGPYPGKGYLTVPRRTPEAATKKQLEEQAECVFHPTIGKVSVALSLARHDRQQYPGRDPDLEYVKAMTARAVAKRKAKDRVTACAQVPTLVDFISEDSFSNKSVEKEKEMVDPETKIPSSAPIRRSSAIGTILKVEEQRTASKILTARHEHLKAEKEAHPFRPTLIKPPKTVVPRYKTDRDSLGLTIPPPPPDPEPEPEPEFQFTARIKSVMSSEGAESDHRKTAPLNSVRGELYSEGGSPECEEIKTDKHSYYIQRHSSNQDSDFLRSSRRQSIGSFDSQTSSTTADTRMPGRAELPAKMHNRQVAPAAPAVLVASDRERSGPRRPSTLSDSATNIQEDLIAVLQSKTEDYDTDEVRSHNTVKKLFGSDTVDSKSRTSQTTVVHSHRQVDRSISSKGQERERLSNKKPEWDGNKKIIYNEGGSWPVSSSSRRDSGAKLFNSSRTLTAKSATARTHSTASAVLPHRGQAPAASALPINPTREHHAHFQDERSSNTSSRWCSSLDKGRRSDGKTSRSDDYFAIAAARGIRTRTMGDHGSFIPPPLPLEVQRRRQIGRREMY